MLSLQVDRLDLARVSELRRGRVLDPRVLLPAAPQGLGDLDGFVGAFVPFGSRSDFLTVVRGHQGITRGHRVPSGAAVAHHVQRLELACGVVRLVERGGSGGDQPDALGAAGNRGQRHHGVQGEHGSFLFRPLTHSGEIGEEEERELAPLGGLGVPHLGVKVGVVGGTDTRCFPGHGLRSVAVTQLHAEDHLSFAHGSPLRDIRRHSPVRDPKYGETLR